jgi:hypothetical protein
MDVVAEATVDEARRLIFGSNHKQFKNDDKLTHTAQTSRSVGRVLRSFIIHAQKQIDASLLVDVIERIFAPSSMSEEGVNVLPIYENKRACDEALISTFVDLLWNQTIARTAAVCEKFIMATRTNLSTGSLASSKVLTPMKVVELLASTPMALSINGTTQTISFFSGGGIDFPYDMLDIREKALLYVITHRRHRYLFETSQISTMAGLRGEVKELTELKQCRYDALINSRISRTRILAHYFAGMTWRVDDGMRQMMASALQTIVIPPSSKTELCKFVQEERERFRELLKHVQKRILDVATLQERFFPPPIHV